MTSWNIIGWVLITLVVLALLRVALRIVWVYVLHLMSRKVKPAPFQMWAWREGPKATFITIERIADNGRIVWTTKLWSRQLTGMTTSDSPEEWAARVRNRHAWLYREQSPYWKDS